MGATQSGARAPRELQIAHLRFLSVSLAILPNRCCSSFNEQFVHFRHVLGDIEQVHVPMLEKCMTAEEVRQGCRQPSLSGSVGTTDATKTFMHVKVKMFRFLQ
jgi:hypothetical protein